MNKSLLKKWVEALVQQFWKIQISMLRACPPICGMIANGGLQAHKSRIKSLLPMAIQVPHALMLHWRDKRKRRVVLAQVYLGITTRCTLNCDKCLSYVPDLPSHSDAPITELLEDIQALFSCVDYIYDFCIGGGEPMLHPALDQIILACAASGKAGNIKLLTNGTVVPQAKLLAALRDTKTQVNISNYPAAPQPDIGKIKEILKENGIRHYVIPATNDYWVDPNSFSGQLKEGSPVRRFNQCFFRLYYSYISGQLHLCCQSAILAYHARVPTCEEDYINMRAVNPDAFRAQLRKLNKRNSISACSYCLGHNYKTPKIPPAIQREGIAKND